MNSHGGANIQVMKMLLEMEDPNKAEEWVEDKLERGGRVIGNGTCSIQDDRP